MTNPTWETIEPPKADPADIDSPFLKWGDLAGQDLTVVVLDFSSDGGLDYKGNPCPRVDMQIVQPGGYNIQDGQQIPLNPGDKITWQGNTPIRLALGLKEANPVRGDLMKLTHKGTYKTAAGTGKTIEIQIARGAGGQYLTAPAAPADPFKAAAPF